MWSTFIPSVHGLFVACDGVMRTSTGAFKHTIVCDSYEDRKNMGMMRTEIERRITSGFIASIHPGLLPVML